MKEILVERREKLLRIAIRNKSKLKEVIVEEISNEPVIGEIYKGRIKNIVPGANSIFVDIGLEKEAYLYYSNELKASGIKKGDNVIVEVIKEPIDNKGAKVTVNYSIPSKYLVLESKGKGIEFSKRFKDDVKKELLKAEIKEVKDAKLIVRTEAANVSLEEIEIERQMLIQEYESIKNKMNYSTKLGKVYGYNVTLNKVLRDNIGMEPVKIILNDKQDYDYAKDYLKNQENASIKLYDESRNLFESYDIEKELIKLRHNKVILPCGGSIVIDKTEAMYVIDVNTGKNIKERNFEKTILDTNIEAAKEIGKQILLRNLSGIIVIDFIDQREKANKSIVLKELKEALKDDIGNIKVFPFTELNLVQISRKRRGKSVYEYMEERCPLCNGVGNLLKLSYIEELICNEIDRYSSENGINEFLIELDEVYEKQVKEDIVDFLKNIHGLDKEIYINYVHGIDGYRVEPLIFQNQKKNIESYKINIER